VAATGREAADASDTTAIKKQTTVTSKVINSAIGSWRWRC